jgi:hypothetical protein
VSADQIRLLATACNNLGVGALLAGIIVPWVNHAQLGGDALGWYTFGVIWIAIAQAALWEIE